MMLRMRYVAVHGYIVMTMPTIVVCDCLSYSSLPYPFLHAHIVPWKRNRSPMSSMSTLCPSLTRYSSPICPTGPLTPGRSILMSGNVNVISLQGRLLSNTFYRRKRFCIHSPEFSLWLPLWTTLRLEECVNLTVTLFAVVHTYCIHYVEARIRSMAPARLPLKSVWQTTKVEPFNLKTEERGHQHNTKWLQNRCVSLANLHVCALGGTYIQWW